MEELRDYILNTIESNIQYDYGTQFEIKWQDNNTKLVITQGNEQCIVEVKIGAENGK